MAVAMQPGSEVCRKIGREFSLLAQSLRVTCARVCLVAALQVLAAAAGVGARASCLDLGLPDSLYIQGSLEPPDYALAVTAQGGYAYVADWMAGLQVVDIVDPSSPVLRGGLVTLGDVFGLAVAGSFAYLAEGSYGMQVIDISDSSSPTAVG